MISFSCACGKTLRVKDEFAGKRVRCPGCGEPLRIPTRSVVSEDDFLEDDPQEDNADEEENYERALPSRRSSKKNSRSGKKSKRGKQHGGFALTWRRVGGVLAILLGILVSIGILLAVANGNMRAIRAVVFALVLFGTGITWLRGETAE